MTPIPQRLPQQRQLEIPRRSSDIVDLVQTGDTVHQSLSRTKRLSKFSSVNDNNRRNSLNLIKTARSQEDELGDDNRSKLRGVIENRPSQQQQQPTHHYAKHTNSMREIKSSRLNGILPDSGNMIRSKLMSNGSGIRGVGQDSSVNFVRPLKTSTALCLADLRAKPIGNQLPKIMVLIKILIS